MDAGVRLRLFGEFELTTDGEAVPIASARVRSMLGYLAVHADSRHSRARLAYRMWPDSSDGQARTNLRNLLHQLRRADPVVETLVEIGRDTLAWIGGSAWVDVHDFDIRTASGTIDDLRIASDLYRGDLLEDSYEDWLADARERYRAAGLAALGRLAAALDERGKSEELLTVARRLVRHDPLAEEHHRFVIRACVAAGDRPAALRAFHACAAVLRDELGVAPSASTEALLSLDGLVAGSAGAGGTGPDVVTTPIVGRDVERAALGAAWAEVTRVRQPKLVTVAGEPGVGKTRLAEEFAAWTARAGAFVARSRAYAGEGDLPYGALVDWLRAAAEHAPAEQWPVTDRIVLTRIVPDLAGAAPAAPPLDPDQRSLLWSAAVRALTAVARPIVLLADDVMWADPASLQFVHYLVRAADHPVLVIATVRIDEMDDRAEHPVAVIERALAALDRHVRIPLVGLEAAATRELAETLLGSSLNDDRAAALHAETGGNPLFVLESIRAGWGPDGEPEALTPKLQAVISGRLEQLTAAAREVVAVAAVVGRAFTSGLLAVAGRFEDTTLVAALDELWRRGVIAEHGADGYDFTHGAVRDAALAGVGPATRRLLHGRIAEALAAGDDADAGAAHVAAHFAQSGRPVEAVDWYLRAALWARRMHADHASVAALERAQALVPELPPTDRAAFEWEILAMLPTALVGVVGYSSPQLHAVHDRAHALAAELGAEPGRPLLRSRVMAALCRDDFAGAEAMTRDLRSMAGHADDPAWVLECEYLLGVIDFWSARVHAAAEHFAAVRDGFDPATRAEHIVNFGNDPQVVCVSRLANSLWFAGEPDQARRVCAHARALAESAGHRLTYEVALVFGALLALDLGEPEQFVAAAAAFGTSQDRSAVHSAVGTCLAGASAALSGDASGLADVERALASGGGVNLAPGHRACLTRIHVAAALAVGDPASGLQVVEAALGLGGTRLWEPELRRARAELLAETGAPTAVVAAELDTARRVAAMLHLPGHLAALETTAKRLSNGASRTILT